MANVIMAGVLGLGAFLATGALLAVGTRGKWFGLIYFSSLFLVLFWGAAYFFDFKRLYVYGLMASSSAFVGEWLYYQWRVPHHGLPVTFGITAAVISAIGIVRYVRFLRTHPLPPKDEAVLEEE